MKKTIVILMGLMLISFCFGEIVEIKDIYYEPSPVEPGKDFYLWIKIDNVGTEALSNLRIEFVDNYPFTLVPGEKRVKEYGYLPSRTSILVKYRVKVDEKAPEGVNYAKIRVQYGPYPIEKSIEIYVKAKESALLVKEVNISPKNIIPGRDFNIKLKLKNIAESVIKNVKVSLILFDRNTNFALPFTILDNSNLRIISSLNIGEEKTINFHLIGDPSASPGIYKIPLIIEYSDNENNKYSEEVIVGLILNDLNDIIIPMLEDNVVTPSKENEINVKFVNKGLGEIKGLVVRVDDSNEFQLIGDNLRYIGKIETDDYEIATYKIIPKVCKRIPIKIHYEYLDYFNNIIKKETTLYLDCFNTETRKNTKFNPNWILIPIVILIIIILYKVWIIKRRNLAKK